MIGPRTSAILTAALSMLALQCGSPKSDQESPPPEYTIEQFMETEAIGGSSFSPDESKILFSSNESGIYNCYEIAATGGEKQALTNSTDDYAFAMGLGAKRVRTPAMGRRAYQPPPDAAVAYRSRVPRAGSHPWGGALRSRVATPGAVCYSVGAAKYLFSLRFRAYTGGVSERKSRP